MGRLVRHCTAMATLRARPSVDFVDGDFTPRCLRDAASSPSSALQRALCVRTIEDNDGREPGDWFVLACVAFDDGDFETCSYALRRCATLNATFARDPRFALRRAHCAFRLGVDDVVEAVDATFAALEAARERVPEDVAAAISVDVCGVEVAWAGKTKTVVRRETLAAFERAKNVLEKYRNV